MEIDPLASVSSDWEAMRAQMPVAGHLAYFDHAAVAPLTGAAEEAIRAWLSQATEQGGAVWPRWAQRVEQVRKTVANLIAASPGEIAFVPNTTAGINLVAEGLDYLR